MVHLTDLLASIRATAARPWDASQSLPPEAYTNAELLELERSQLFRRQWMCLGRADEVEGPGAFLTGQIDCTPVAVVRQKSGDLKAFANVCSHRSMLPIQGKGTARGFTCPYHGWTYALDGSLVSAAHMPGTFCKTDNGLRELRLEEWLGFVFVNLHDAASPLGEDLRDLTEFIADYQIGRMRIFRRDSLQWKCNWKIALENGIEPYHINVTHRETLAPFIPVGNAQMRRGHSKFFAYEHQLVNPAPERMPASFIPNTSGSSRIREIAVAGAIYPNIAYAVGYEWLWWITCHPISPFEARIDHGIAAAFDLKGEAADPSNPAYYFLNVDTAFMGEDLDRVEAVQRGVASGYARQAMLSPYEEPIYGFIRYLADTLCPTPKAPRATVRAAS